MDVQLRTNNVNEIISFLLPAKAKWDIIGALLGVDVEKMMAINKRCKTVEECLYSVIIAWTQDGGDKTTYAYLVKVLRSKRVKRKDIATKITEAKGKQSHSRADILHEIRSTSKLLGNVHPPAIVESCPLPNPVLEKYLRVDYSKQTGTRDDEWPPSFNIEYVNLVLVPQEKMPMVKAGAEEKILFHILGNITFITGQRLGLSDILAFDSDRVTVINGGPGAGKTTLATKLRKEWACRQLFTGFHLTLYVPLREPIARLSENIDDLLNYFGEKCSKADRELIKANGGAGVLFILDGWDELRLSCRGVQQFFPKLISGSTLPRSKAIVLSRPGASTDILRHADQVIEVLGFTKEQVNHYIQMDFAADREGAVKLIDDLEKYPNIASACYVPINLAIVCYVYKALNFNLPQTITEVYQWFIIHTVKRYLKRKQTIEDIQVNLPPIYGISDFFESITFNDSVKKHFNDSIIETLQSLGELALNGLQNEDLCFSRRQLLASCRLDEQDVQFDGFGLLKPVQLRLCAGIEQYFHFLHLSVQEFIAAFYVSQMVEGKQEEILKKIDHEKYSTVFKHFCGINQFKSAPLRALFEGKGRVELYHLEGIHEGQWHDHCKEIARKYENTYRFGGQNLQPHQWEVLSYIMLKSGTQWSFECYSSLLDANGMVCFGRHLSESSQILRRLCFRSVHIDHQAYIHIAKSCQLQTGLTELEFIHCNMTDEGVFTILRALNSHHSLKILRVLDDSPTAQTVHGFTQLLPTLPSLQQLELNIESFGDNDYVDIIKCAKQCNSALRIGVTCDLSHYFPDNSHAGIYHIEPSVMVPLVDHSKEPKVKLDELLKHVGIEKEELNQCCQDFHLQEIALLLHKCDPVDIPRLNLSASDFSSSETILQGLQTWKKTDDFRATYECLAKEFLSCGKADLAEEVCKFVKRASLVTATPSQSKELLDVSYSCEDSVDSVEEKACAPVKGILESKPKLHELDRLEHESKVVSVFKMCASQWEKIALRLYFEGYSISTIERDNAHSVEAACRQVFMEWLSGVEQLREPRTWSTVMTVLNEAELSEVATKLGEILTHRSM